jgi:protein TonB
MKVSDAALPAPSPVESVTDNSKNTSDDTATGKSASKAETYSEANFKANYGINPKPTYPPLARSRGWEGKVLLRVNVSADGHADSVAIYRSSDHEVLDESAVEAVEKWLFIPAKQGDKAVSCTVIVPINFTLNN